MMAGTPVSSGAASTPAPASGSTSAPAAAQLPFAPTAGPAQLPSGSTPGPASTPTPAPPSSTSAPTPTLPPALQRRAATRAARASATTLRTAIAAQAALLRPDVATAYVNLETTRRNGRLTRARTSIRNQNPGLDEAEIERRAQDRAGGLPAGQGAFFVQVRSIGALREGVPELMGRVWFVEDADGGRERLVAEGGGVRGSVDEALGSLLERVRGMVGRMRDEQEEGEDEVMEEQYEWRGSEDEEEEKEEEGEGEGEGEGEDEEMADE